MTTSVQLFIERQSSVKEKNKPKDQLVYSKITTHKTKHKTTEKC